MMRALVVYESMFGNTGQVARAVADGIAEHMAVDVVTVTEAPAPLEELVDLVVVGGPTHAFSMTRHNTREDAVRQGAHADPATGIREWLDRLHTGPHSEAVATFDTRVAKVKHLPGSAAKAAAKVLRREGYSHAVTGPESFWVEDVPGPLLDGELDRAREWGRGLARSVAAAATAS